MMSLIDLHDEQRWVPTHVNVTVLRARGLRTKSKHGSRYLYTVIRVGKEKHTTGLVEKAEVPEWDEECCFELLPGILEDGGRSGYPPGSGDLVLTVMHRVLIGLDVFLGQTVIPLDKIFRDGTRPRDEWFKLSSKSGRKEKERGELQVTVQFTRNNMTASMFDLTVKDKPRSAFGKLKDRVTGRKRGDVESSSAIVPGRYAALSGAPGQSFGEAGGGALESPDVEVAEEKRSVMKEFFKGRLRKTSDSRSCSSLTSESSVFSTASDNPPPSLGLLSDPPSSPVYTTKVRVDTHYGDTDLAKKVLTSQHTTKVLTHKRAFSDEAGKITTPFPRTNPAVESLKGQTMTQSKSSMCINGSHVYDSEPSTPKSSAAHASKLVLLEKCSPLSRSLQNLTRRSEDKGSFAEGRRWSFDKTKKEEKEEEKESLASSPPVQQAQTGGATPGVSSSGDSPDKGRKLRKTLFSGGRSDSFPAKSDGNQTASTSEGRRRSWFVPGDSQNKPRLEVSPKVESSSDVPPPLPPRSPVPLHCSSPSVSPSGHVSLDDYNYTNPFTPSPSPSSIPISPSNPFPSHIQQRNPFFDELVAEESKRSPPFATYPSTGPSPINYTTLPFRACTSSPYHVANATNMASIKRERPRPVARQISLPALLPKAAPPNSSNAPRSMSESTGEWEDSFDAFACSRLSSPKGPQKQPRTRPTSFNGCSGLTVNDAQELHTYQEEPPPLPPRRLLRTPVNEIYSDGWLHRGQELAVHKEAYLLSQTGVASQQRREGDCKIQDLSPDPHASSEASDTLSDTSQPLISITSPASISKEKLTKFKYEPLEGDTDCWGGMLFEQDLYGRICRGNYGQPKVNAHQLSVNAEKTKRSKIVSRYSGPKMLLDGEMSVADLLTLSSVPSKPDAKVLDNPPAQLEETENTSPDTVDNVAFSLTVGDLNVNMSNSDFTFLDSDTLKGIGSFDGTVSKPSEDSLIAACHSETPQDVFTLKDTYIPEMNSSFEITASSNKLCKVSPVCQNNCQACRCELRMASHGTSRRNSREMTGLSSQTSNPPDLEPRADVTRGFDNCERTTQDIDDNGNPQGKIGSANLVESFSGVVSARIRPKGASRQYSGGSPNHQSKSADGEFEQLLSLVQNITGASEGPQSYQPTKSALSTLLAFNKQADSQEDSTNKGPTQNHESSSNSQMSPKDSLKESHVAVQFSELSFKDLHARVAPSSRTPSKTEQSSQGPEPPSSFTHRVLSLPADAQAGPHPDPLRCPSIHPPSIRPSAGASTTLAVPPYTSSSSSSSSSSTNSSTDQPQVDARHSLLPEETQPAHNLPHQESRPHPVKPITCSQSEKREGRSVLEKLKSTIHPGRTAQPVAAEPDRSQEVTVERSAQYQHLTNMELISLLLQQEMDVQKQQAASELQETQLLKCEAELKKVKSQVRDLEDYIDNLLLRIMEQTPTLLQVRARQK